MSSIFSKIIAAEIPSYKIAEDERFFAFLDIFPLAKGHVLVVSKIEVDYIFELDDNTLGDMMIFAKRVAKAIDQVIECERVGVAVIGLEVPHAHIHLVPLNSINDINFTQPKLTLPKEELADIAQKISSAFI